MAKFRKLPVVIEAIQLTAGNPDEVLEFMGILNQPFHECGYGIDPADGKFKITTLEGIHAASIGDWIIRGIHGEFYPCKPDIFAKTYEPCSHAEQEAKRELSDTPLWKLMESVFLAGRTTGHCDRLGYAAELRAVADELLLRFKDKWNPALAAVERWLLQESLVAEGKETSEEYALLRALDYPEWRPLSVDKADRAERGEEGEND